MLSASRMSLCVVNPETAFCILNTRGRQEISGGGCLVNVYGKLTYVSEVVKIKDLLFIVKFIPNVDVIVKRREFLHWQQQLSPYKEYILTELRPTRLRKGSSLSQRVFTVTENSKLLQPDGVDVTFVTVSDWLKQHGLLGALEDKCSVNLQNLTGNLFSYQGKVTAVLDKGLGVFELDNTVRLYVGPVPAAHKFTMMNVGATILVQNAHYTTSKQPPKVSMYCCMLSSVKCIGSPVEKGSSLRLSQTLLKLLYLEGQSQSQLNQMFMLRQVLRKQFEDTLGERVTEKIFSTVIGNAELICNGRNRKNVAKGPQRVLIDEFLNIPHNCPLQKADKENVCFRTIAEVKNSICDISSETMEWQHVRQLSGETEVILGILEVSEATGQLLICDDTGSIQIVTCCYHGDRETVTDCDHKCLGACDCDKTEIGDRFPCPYVHLCCIGRIVAITVYELVSETMVTRNASVLKGLSIREMSRSCCDKYLLFDMRNVINIGNFTKSLKTDIRCTDTGLNSECCSDRTKELCGRSEARQSDGAVAESHLQTAKGCSSSKSLNTGMAKCNIDSKTVVQSITDVSEGKFDSVGGYQSNAKQNASSLHKHVKADGSLMFCRKADCCEKTVSQTTEIVSQNTEKEVSFFSLNPKSGADQEIGAENIVHVSKKVSTNSSFLPNQFGKTAFKVKPVANRKRPLVEMQVDNPNNSRLNKLPRVDLEKSQDVDEEDLVDRNAEVLHDKASEAKNFDYKSVCDGTRDVIVFIENKGSLISEDKLLRFSMECTALRKEGPDKLILEFLGKSVKWYPLLYPSTCYKLSVCTEDVPVLSVGLTNDKLRKVLQKSKARRCFIVNGNVSITRVWNIPLQSCGLVPVATMSVQDILKPDFSEKFVNFEGWILNKTLMKPGFGPKSLAKDIGCCGMYSRLHVQNPSRSDDLWVYLNDSNILCERGLVPGSRVRFYGLERRLSQLNNIYCRLVPLSSVQILCVEAERDMKKHQSNQNREYDHKQLPVLHLVDVWTLANAGLVFQSICDVEKILKVSLKCLCETCGSLLIEALCSNTACNGDGAYRFLARASAIIDDSTSMGMVTLTGSSVQSMLQLSHDQWKCLEEEVSQTGEVFVQQFNPPLCNSLERFVYKLCDNHAVKHTWLMTLKTRSSLDINKIGRDEFCMKSFDTGSSRITTQCLPFLQLECLALNIFEPSVWSVHHLSSK